MNTLLGIKKYQTQGFLENGIRIPVTVVAASSNVIIGLKTADKDNYTAVTLGFGKTKKSTKALLGIAKKANLTEVPRKLREVRVSDTANRELGKALHVDDVFKPGDLVDVTGTSKGKGFAGGVKRYNFKGGPKTHGQSDRHRAPGSIGSGTTPGRVYRGKRMAGNMGKETVTVKNLLVIDVDSATNTLFIKGLVPGIMGGIIEIAKIGEVKSKNFVPRFTIQASQLEAEESVVEETKAETEQAQVATPAAEQPQEEKTQEVQEAKK